jgi:ABC-2 type transport system ATP-binding protein
MDEAERCDRVLLLDRGRALALDAPQTLQRSLSGTFIALRADRPRSARDLLRSRPDVVTATLFGDTVHAFLHEGRGTAEIVDTLREHGLVVEDARAVEPSLEDVFVHLLDRLDEDASHAA